MDLSHALFHSLTLTAINTVNTLNTHTVMLCSCAYLDVVLSYEVRLPILQNLEEYFHEMIQKCWVLWRFNYHLQVTKNDMQCDMDLNQHTKKATSKMSPNSFFHVTAF